MLFPILAPSRLTIRPTGSSPIKVAVITIGPSVTTVSPPRSLKSKRSCTSLRPELKFLKNISSVVLGNATDNKYPIGEAPFAAKSDKLTLNSLLDNEYPESSLKK